MRVLLDTHVLIWWDAGSRLSAAAMKAIRTADDMFVGSASAWELTIKSSLGKISGTCTVAAARLPSHHRDPFGWMLIAQAQVEGLVVISRDQSFARYDLTLIPAQRWDGPSRFGITLLQPRKVVRHFPDERPFSLSENLKMSRSRVLLVLAASIMAGADVEPVHAQSLPANIPTPAQAQDLVQNRPELVAQLRQRIQASGLSADQLRARLRAAGYPESLLEQVMGGATPGTSTPPSDSLINAGKSVV